MGLGYLMGVNGFDSVGTGQWTFRGGVATVTDTQNRDATIGDILMAGFGIRPVAASRELAYA